MYQITLAPHSTDLCKKFSNKPMVNYRYAGFGFDILLHPGLSDLKKGIEPDITYQKVWRKKYT